MKIVSLSPHTDWNELAIVVLCDKLLSFIVPLITYCIALVVLMCDVQQ